MEGVEAWGKQARKGKDMYWNNDISLKRGKETIEYKSIPVNSISYNNTR